MENEKFSGLLFALSITILKPIDAIAGGGIAHHILFWAEAINWSLQLGGRWNLVLQPEQWTRIEGGGKRAFVSGEENISVYAFKSSHCFLEDFLPTLAAFMKPFYLVSFGIHFYSLKNNCEWGKGNRNLPWKATRCSKLRELLWLLSQFTLSKALGE